MSLFNRNKFLTNIAQRNFTSGTSVSNREEHTERILNFDNVLYTTRSHNSRISKTTVHIQIQIHENTNTGENRRTQIYRRLHCSCTNGFINFWLWFFDTSSMVQPQNINTMIGPQLLNTMVGPRLLNIIVGPNFSPSWSDPNFNCLPQWQTTQLSVYIVQTQLPTDSFKILKFSGPSLPGMTSFTVQPHFLSGVYYDNFDCHIVCVRA